MLSNVEKLVSFIVKAGKVNEVEIKKYLKAEKIQLSGNNVNEAIAQATAEMQAEILPAFIPEKDKAPAASGFGDLKASGGSSGSGSIRSEMLKVKHETPQVILIDNGKAKDVLNHNDVNQTELDDLVM